MAGKKKKRKIIIIITYKAIVKSLPRTSTTFLHITVKIPKLTKNQSFLSHGAVTAASKSKFPLSSLNLQQPQLKETQSQPYIDRINTTNRVIFQFPTRVNCISHIGTNFQETSKHNMEIFSLYLELKHKKL